jgi:uncharacterized membrane protein YeaQ/YmgE (transglycosylase-associated protein family)
MGILSWIVIGGLAGWIASLIMNTDASQGIFLNVVVGIIGAFLGGFAFSYLGGTGVTGFNFWSLIVATIGAIVVIWITRAVRS